MSVGSPRLESMESGIYFDNPEQQPKRTGRRWGWVLIAIVAAAVLVGSYLKTPYVIERPGPVFNVLGNEGNTPIIQVSDAKSYPTDGALDLLTVNVVGSPGATPSWLELLGAWLDPSQVITPIDEIYPANTNTTQVEKQNALMMSDSQSQATAAGLRALGYRYTYIVYVDTVDARSASAGVLDSGDILLTANDKKITGIDSLRAAVNAGGGAPVKIAGTRSGKPFSYIIKPRQVSGSWRIGVYVGTRFKFPINVKLSLNDVGGPSGGMMFALGIYDKLTPGSLTGGQIIAGTGTIDEQGTVGPIGGIRQKLYGALRGGAKWFLAPAQNCSEVIGHIPSGIQVVKVSNFSQALTAVKQIASEKSVKGLPSCGN
jgi:Lon-like protease